MLRLALIALVLSFPQLAGADCAMVGLTPKVLTPANTTITGGVVVGSVGLDGGKLETGEIAVQKGWKLKKGKPTITTLAPGLALYSAPADDELFDAAGTSLLKFKVATTKSALTALTITKATHSGKSGGYHTPERVRLDLASPLPTSAVAVILTDAKGAPRSWWKVEAASKEIYGFYQSDCTPLPNGTQLSKPGDSIKIQYVDASGAVSPLSTAITIR
jgi:hypothetical protein